MDRDLRLLGKLHGESLNERAFIELLLGVRLYFGREGLRACRMLGTEPWGGGGRVLRAFCVWYLCVRERGAEHLLWARPLGWGIIEHQLCAWH